jgi:hypothetical protein
MTCSPPHNLKYMWAVADAWPDEPIMQQAAARIQWSHSTPADGDRVLKVLERRCAAEYTGKPLLTVAIKFVSHNGKESRTLVRASGRVAAPSLRPVCAARAFS